MHIAQALGSIKSITPKLAPASRTTLVADRTCAIANSSMAVAARQPPAISRYPRRPPSRRSSQSHSTPPARLLITPTTNGKAA